MKVLFATIYDYPHAGGLSSHIATLKNGLESLGHSVEIVSFSDVPKWKQVLCAKGPGFLLNKLHKGSGIVWSNRIRGWFLHAQLRNRKMQGYDVVNAQDPFATLAALKAGYPTVSTVHGYMTFESISKGSMRAKSWASRQMKAVEADSFACTGAIVTVDTRLKQYVESVSGVVGTTIHNFIDVDGFHPDHGRKMEYRLEHGISADAELLFCPRRLTKKNGVVYPALALADVRKARPNTQLIYAGDGEALDEIKEIVATGNLGDCVTILGSIPHDDMNVYYAMADVVLIPSIHSDGVQEATSISALEAMGCGAPLIACSVGGLKEIIEDGVDGVLVEEQNVSALAVAIIDLLQNQEKGVRLALAAREKIESNYSHLSAAKQYISIYESVIIN